MLEQNKIYNGDCLELMKDIEDKSIDMILCDPPFGTTNCKWDSVIPFKPLWEQYKRVIKEDGALVLFGSQPFTSALIMSNPEMFKYEWIWEKTLASGQLNAKIMPMKIHENIIVFGKGKIKYNPQMGIGEPYTIKRNIISQDCYGKQKPNIKVNNGERYPKSVINFPNSRIKNGYATQKPVSILEYLIKTYTNDEGECVLDSCIGSASTIIACKNTGRNYIGIEKNEKVFNMAIDRISGYIHLS